MPLSEAVCTLPMDTTVLLMDAGIPPCWIIDKDGRSGRDVQTIEVAFLHTLDTVKYWNPCCTVVLFTETAPEDLSPMQRLVGQIKKQPGNSGLDFKGMEKTLTEVRLELSPDWQAVQELETVVLLYCNRSVLRLVSLQQLDQFQSAVRAAQAAIRLAATPNPQNVKLINALKKADSIF